ncbi:mRNA-capping enzyme subunit beta [Gryganskiella cystojenkinii]|nr:mRNA-capping enzyme subunit beta [Gryganskiella cystojenkinii]
MADQENQKRPLSDTEEETSVATSTESLQTSSAPVQKKARHEETDTTSAPLPPPPGATATVPTSEQNADKPQSQPQAQQPHYPQQQQQQQAARPSHRDHAFFGSDVLDDVVRTVGEFLFEHCHHKHVEIEAKLGVMIAHNTGRRIELPVRNEVVLNKGHPAWYRFVSDMSLAQHAHFNKILNKRLEQTRQPGFPGTQIGYKHTKEIDQFFKNGNEKTRVTLDQADKKVVGIVRKDRIADLDIFSPRNPFDFRITVNIEVPVQSPVGQPQFERHKDRISYRHHNLKIDLTQVKTNNSPGQQQNRNSASQMRPQPGMNGGSGAALDVTHELEIEFAHAEELTRERDIRIKSNGQQQDRFMDVVASFVNNVRGLAVRGNVPVAAPPHSQQQQPPQQHLQQQPPQYQQQHGQPAMPPPSRQQRRY